MNAGKLDRLATLLKNFPDRAGSGAAVDNWQDVGNAWVSRAGKSGNSGTYGGREAAIVEENFTMRFRSDVEENMRIVVDGQTFDIINVQPIKRRDGLSLVGRVRSK